MKDQVTGVLPKNSSREDCHPSQGLPSKIASTQAKDESRFVVHSIFLLLLVARERIQNTKSKGENEPKMSANAFAFCGEGSMQCEAKAIRVSFYNIS